MPSMTREYCLTTPPERMGFSQKSSCKAQGLLKRSSKKYKDQYIISDKYKRSVKQISKKRRSIKKRKGGALFSDSERKPRAKIGYGDAKRAKETIKNIKKFDKGYQIQVVNSMYNRAKYHANQTSDMRESMKVFKEWLNKYKKSKKL